ncbi:MAG: hypothetical protein O3A57_03495 [Bacteroidetes bacterium]|nr:hypothetical protein [Bacteroidota bacterium]
MAITEYRFLVRFRDLALIGCELAGLKILTAVYLWQTAVSAEGAARLRDALPNADVDDGR